MIGIKKIPDGDYFTYIKCTDDPKWIVKEQVQTLPQKEIDCSLKQSSKNNNTLIGWITDIRTTTQFVKNSESVTTTVEAFRPVAVLHGSSIKESAR